MSSTVKCLRRPCHKAGPSRKSINNCLQTLRITQGGLSHEDALAFVTDQKESSNVGTAVTFLSGAENPAHPVTSSAAIGTAVTFLSGSNNTNSVTVVPAMDPTQQSYVDHMCAWADAYLSVPDACNNNLPLPVERNGTWQLQDSVLLLGTAGTGKTTTVQAANKKLEDCGLKGRIVRAAYTGVAASNMGSGARTIVSLFRLKTNRGSGPLQPLATEEMQAMATELGDMAVLEIDEVSMIEKPSAGAHSFAAAAMALHMLSCPTLFSCRAMPLRSSTAFRWHQSGSGRRFWSIATSGRQR